MNPAVIVLIVVLWIAVGAVIVFLAFSGGLNNIVDKVLPFDCAAQFDEITEMRNNLPKSIQSIEHTQKILDELEDLAGPFRDRNCIFTVDQWKDDAYYQSDLHSIDWDMFQEIMLELKK